MRWLVVRAGEGEWIGGECGGRKAQEWSKTTIKSGWRSNRVKDKTIRHMARADKSDRRWNKRKTSQVGRVV